MRVDHRRRRTVGSGCLRNVPPVGAQRAVRVKRFEMLLLKGKCENCGPCNRRRKTLIQRCASWRAARRQSPARQARRRSRRSRLHFVHVRRPFDLCRLAPWRNVNDDTLPAVAGREDFGQAVAKLAHDGVGQGLVSRFGGRHGDGGHAPSIAQMCGLGRIRPPYRTPTSGSTVVKISVTVAGTCIQANR